MENHHFHRSLRVEKFDILKGDETMIIILFTLFVIIVVSLLGIEEDLDCYEAFDRKKRGKRK